MVVVTTDISELHTNKFNYESCCIKFGLQLVFSDLFCTKGNSVWRQINQSRDSQFNIFITYKYFILSFQNIYY